MKCNGRYEERDVRLEASWSLKKRIEELHDSNYCHERAKAGTQTKIHSIFPTHFME
jgi:hypothetical protein